MHRGSDNFFLPSVCPRLRGKHRKQCWYVTHWVVTAVLPLLGFALTLGASPGLHALPTVPGTGSKGVPTIPGATIQEEPPGDKWLEREGMSFGGDFTFGKLWQGLSNCSSVL